MLFRSSAVVQALEAPGAASASYAVERLATILRSYTVYLDLWVVDAQGRVIANGRPHPLIAPFGLDRFARGRLIREGGVDASR